MGLPPMPFVRLIWKESRFNPSAVSPKGAQGIAQFMPATADDRGLDDPFEPKSAIVHSASLLADLRQEFGNFGLAAAAYNAGAERVRAWLAGNSGLPCETAGLCRIRHRPRGGGMEAARDRASRRAEEPPARRCMDFVPQPRAAGGAGGLRNGAADGERGLAALGRARVDRLLQGQGARPVRAGRSGDIASVLADREPFVLPERNLSRGRRYLYMVQIGADSRDDAAKLCAQLRADGGACIVQKN